MATIQRPTEAVVTQEQQLNELNELLAQLGWVAGTRVRFNALDKDTIVLMRLPAATPPPEGWAAHFAGKLTGVFGTHEENLRYLDEERKSWADELEESE